MPELQAPEAPARRLPQLRPVQGPRGDQDQVGNDRGRRRWAALPYAATYVLLALPFATLYSACSHDRIDTINGYQTLAQHDYTYTAADGSAHMASVPADGFSWIVIALVAVGIVLGLVSARALFLSVTSTACLIALFLMVTAAGGRVASSQGEVGFWLSSVAVALAPAAAERSRRRAVAVGGATVLTAAAIIGLVILLVYLTASARR